MLYLAGAGVGAPGIADSDVRELPNLQRQTVHFTADVGKPKVETSKSWLQELNPDVKVESLHERVTEENARQSVADYDVVVDGCDNPETCCVLNAACDSAKKPFVHGSILGYEGRATTFTYDPGTPCYRCVFPSAPPPGSMPTGAEARIASPVPGLIGMIQVAEVIKLILGTGELLVGRMILYDIVVMEFRELRLRRDPAVLSAVKSQARDPRDRARKRDAFQRAVKNKRPPPSSFLQKGGNMRHLKVVVFLAAIVVMALLILNLKKESAYDKVEEVKSLAAKEFLGIKLLDIFLGVLGLAFVGILAGYIVSLVKGGGRQRAAADLQVAASGEAAVAGQPVAPAAPRKKLALEKVLGRTGTKIFSVAIVILIILVVLAIVILLFADKLTQRFPFLQRFLENLEIN